MRVNSILTLPDQAFTTWKSSICLAKEYFQLRSSGPLQNSISHLPEKVSTWCVRLRKREITAERSSCSRTHSIIKHLSQPAGKLFPRELLNVTALAGQRVVPIPLKIAEHGLP